MWLSRADELNLVLKVYSSPRTIRVRCIHLWPWYFGVMLEKFGPRFILFSELRWNERSFLRLPSAFGYPAIPVARSSSKDDESASARRSARCLIPTNCLCTIMKWTRRARKAITGLGNFMMIEAKSKPPVPRLPLCKQ